MKTFVYYSKNDPNKEIIGKIRSEEINKATKYAADIKRMGLEEFLSIFDIKEYLAQNIK